MAFLKTLVLWGVLLPGLAAAQPMPLKTPLVIPHGFTGWFRVDGGSLAVGGADVFTVESGALTRRAADGLSIRAQSQPHDLVGQPVATPEMVYVLDTVGGVVAFDPVTLTRRWRTLLAGTPQRLTPAGPVLLTGRGDVVTALNIRDGRVAWQVRSLDPDHAATDARFLGGVVLVQHSPAESFQGVVYTAHDPRTGRRLWTGRVGHTFPLAVIGQRAFFDTRQWDNLLGEGGTFALADVDLRTGRRADSVRSLAGLPGKLALWRVVIGTPALDPARTLWLLVQASDGSGTRLVSVDAQNRMRTWPVPHSGKVDADSGLYRLILTTGSVVVYLPGGQVSTLRVSTGHVMTASLPWHGTPTHLTTLGSWTGATSAWGTAVLDDTGRVRVRAQGAGQPVLAGRNILLPFADGIVRFPVR